MAAPMPDMRLTVRQADGSLTSISGPDRQQHRPVHGVFQLANVAGPAMGDDGLARRRADMGKRPLGHAVGGGVFLDEVIGQHADVAGPFAQGRAGADSPRSAGTAGLRGTRLPRTALREVAVGGGDDADVDGDGLGAAHTVDDPLLNRAQQLGLQASASISLISSSSKRAAVGLLELADATRDERR